MNFLKKTREINKKTQKQLSKDLGISQSAVSQMEIGEKIPSMKIFLTLYSLDYIDNLDIIISKLASIHKKTQSNF